MIYSCLSTSRHLHVSYSTRCAVTALRSTCAPTLRSLSTARNAFLGHHLSQNDVGLSDPAFAVASDKPLRHVPLREQLRAWEIENHDLISPMDKLKQRLQDDDVDNDDKGDDFIPDDDDLDISAQDLQDFGFNSTSLRPGDMVELRNWQGSGVELGIYIKDAGRQALFYTMSGKWQLKGTANILFSHRDFVSIEELSPLLQYLPSQDLSSSWQNRLIEFSHALPRNIGAPLLHKMTQFLKDSDNQYRSLISQLDIVFSLVAHGTDLTHTSVSEVADKIAPTMRQENGSYPLSVLYAIHRCLMQDDIGFRPERVGNFRAWGRFEVLSKSAMQDILFAADTVRKHQEHQALLVQSGAFELAAGSEYLLQFGTMAASIIRESRRTRDFTQHGMLGPVKEDLSKPQFPRPCTLDKLTSDPASRMFVTFMKCWCAYRMFNRSSSINSIGSAILRATGMYSEEVLDQTTGWIFLQEIGVISPYESRARWDLRLQALEQTPFPPRQGSLRKDNLAHIRRDWGETPIFCIDDASAKEIDDGVSFEDTEVPGECWIHVHAADPASHIIPKSPIAMFAQMRVSNIYLPGANISMLPKDLVADYFSLAAGRPCLTFSAKVDSSGTLLDYKVTAGVIRNIKYITPAVMREVVDDHTQSDDYAQTIQLGHVEQPGVNRKMLAASDLTLEDKNILRGMAKFARSQRYYTSQRGAIFTRFNNNPVQVSFSHKSKNIQMQDAKLKKDESSDPSIELSLTAGRDDEVVGLDSVMHMMLTAGNVAARWCADRGIPNIFRASQQNPARPSPTKYFSREILPYVKSGSPVPREVVSGYLQLLGPVLPSSAPGPHLPIGLNMYSKATSPLRRYGDMITHWQIGAALLEEKRTGKSLIGNTNQSFLPFSTADIDGIIPALDSRERALRLHQSTAERGWTIVALVRAWKYGEAPLPKTFVFETVVVNRVQLKGTVRGLGNLSWVSVNVGDLPGDVTSETVTEGALFEVGIKSLNAYTNEVVMTPLRAL